MSEPTKTPAPFKCPKCGNDTLRFSIVRTGVYCAAPPEGIGVITEFHDDAPALWAEMQCNSCECPVDAPDAIQAYIQAHHETETGLVEY